jgi:hypothetical protein
MASEAAIVSMAGNEAEKQYALPDKRWWSTISTLPAQNPPEEQSAAMDPIIISTSFAYMMTEGVSDPSILYEEDVYLRQRRNDRRPQHHDGPVPQ